MSEFTRVFGENKGKGNSNMQYSIYALKDGEPERVMVDIYFQDGSPLEEVNGIFNEDLLEILIDRFEGFQSGDFACAENADALHHLKKALTISNSRTSRRKDQGTIYKYEERVIKDEK